MTKAWSLIRQGKRRKTTGAQYDVIMEGVYDARIAADRLDKDLFCEVQEDIVCQKLQEDAFFTGEMLKGMRHNDRDASENPSHQK